MRTWARFWVLPKEKTKIPTQPWALVSFSRRTTCGIFWAGARIPMGRATSPESEDWQGLSVRVSILFPENGGSHTSEWTILANAAADTAQLWNPLVAVVDWRRRSVQTGLEHSAGTSELSRAGRAAGVGQVVGPQPVGSTWYRMLNSTNHQPRRIADSQECNDLNLHYNEGNGKEMWLNW